MAAKEPTVEPRHLDAARDVYKELPGTWAEDVRLIAQALANAETAASEKAWDEGFIAGVNHQLRFNDALDDGELDLSPPVNPYRQPAKGDE